MDKSNGYQIKYIKISSQSNSDENDIMDMVTEFNIYESVFNHSITASAIIFDSIGLISALPIFGGETVEISFKTDESKKFKVLTFIIYSIENRLKDNDNSETYTLRMVTKEAWLDMGMTISKAYSGNYNSIVSTILQNDLLSTKPTELEQGLNVGNFISPYWTPFEIIKWIITRMVGQDGVSPYLFFENLLGYNLKSLSTIYGSDTIKTIKDIPGDLANVDYTDSIKDYRFGDMFNQIKNRYGVFAQTIKTFDINTKSVSIEKPTYKDVDVRMDSFQVKNTLYEYGGNTSTQLKKDDNSHLSTFKRHYLKHIMDIISLDIFLLGTSNLYCGDMIEFDLPKLQKDTENGLEPFISGKYMIQTLKHTLSRDDYHITAKIVKDSVLKDPENI